MKHKVRFSLRLKFMLCISITAICTASVAIAFGNLVFTGMLMLSHNETAYQIAERAADYFEEGELAEYARLLARYENGEAGNGELEQTLSGKRYQDIQARMDSLRENTQANEIYVCVLDMDQLEQYDGEADAAGRWKPRMYIMDSHYDARKQMQFGETGRVLPEYREEIAASYRSGEPADSILPGESQSEATITALAPILEDGDTIACVGVEFPIPTLESDLSTFFEIVAMATAIVTVVLLIVGYLLTSRLLIRPIRLVAAEAERFVGNNHEVSEKLLTIRTRDEVRSLSESLYQMQVDINAYIDSLASVMAEKERIETELNIATQIQADMLPSIFPAFPGRKEFDIFATMTPAKEVGGDFYDFFLIDDDHLGLVMADVSGKGVPAALFMVIAKTLIKNRAQMMSGISYSPGEILGFVNRQLCEGNDAELFVTVWLGILQISTGEGIVSNAGHEYPALRRAGGSYELVKTKHSPAVATIEGIRFREHSFQLYPGDSLYLYTDGVPEATNGQNELFGTDRMLAALNENPDAPARALLSTVKQRVDEFVGEAPQFDDLTMLCLHYLGGEMCSMKELEVEAMLENLEQVLEFVNRELEQSGCPVKAQKQLGLAVEEIYSNIARYAYAEAEAPGTARIRIRMHENPAAAEIIFTDQGTPYNPLEKEDPDVTLNAEDRPIGGLGIYMVKKSMDEVSYEHKDGQNVFRIRKNIQSAGIS